MSARGARWSARRGRPPSPRAKPEALLQLLDLRRQGQRIGGIALEHLDGDRATVGGAHQANDNLRPVAPVVAAVAMLGQFAAASFEVEPALAKAGVEVTS